MCTESAAQERTQVAVDELLSSAVRRLSGITIDLINAVNELKTLQQNYRNHNRNKAIKETDNARERALYRRT
jgi:hypothetical protein